MAAARFPVPRHTLIVFLPQVMKRSASKLLQKSPSTKTVRNASAHPDQLTTILDNALVVFQRVTHLGYTTCIIPKLPAAGQIGIEIETIKKTQVKQEECVKPVRSITQILDAVQKTLE